MEDAKEFDMVMNFSGSALQATLGRWLEAYPALGACEVRELLALADKHELCDWHASVEPGDVLARFVADDEIEYCRVLGVSRDELTLALGRGADGILGVAVEVCAGLAAGRKRYLPVVAFDFRLSANQADSMARAEWPKSLHQLIESLAKGELGQMGETSKDATTNDSTNGRHANGRGTRKRKSAAA